ncbi:MAG: hypothetical protein K2X49_28260 [Acetobacteraceae bacterium]|nr:hypothetical protein [Acetobacteraceae bacterium]
MSTNPRVSMRSGGGRERGEKHSHVAPMRSSKSHATDGASPSGTERAFRENRSRRDRAADARATDDGPGENEGGEGEDDEGEEAAASGSSGRHGVNLPVILNTDSSVQGTEQLGARVERIVQARLRHLAPHLTRVEAYLTDANRGGQGPSDLRCALEARPSDAKPVGADGTAATAEEAVRGAAGKLARLLRTQFGRRRSERGRETIRDMS